MDRLVAALERAADALTEIAEALRAAPREAAPARGPDASTEIGGRARAARGSEREGPPIATEPIGTRESAAVGTPVANVRTNGRTLFNEEKNTFVRTYDERTEFCWDTVAAETDDDWNTLQFTCERIRKIVRPKRGRWWKADRSLIATAAALAARFDAAGGDDRGSRWLGEALTSVERFNPQNTAAYFQSCLVLLLGDLDPVMHDKATAQMLWVRLAKSVSVPEQWLREPGEAPRQKERTA